MAAVRWNRNNALNSPGKHIINQRKTGRYQNVVFADDKINWTEKKSSEETLRLTGI